MHKFRYDQIFYSLFTINVHVQNVEKELYDMKSMLLKHTIQAKTALDSGCGDGKISKKMNLPIISKDSIKESLFDSLGVKDREWSKRLGVASYKIMYKLLESFLEAEQPVILENNFNPNFDSKKFFDLRTKYNFDILQIICKTDGEILFERFKRHSESGERHPGHIDDQNYDEFQKTLLKEECQPLNIESEIFEVDTTDFERIDYDSIYKLFYEISE